jgi:hypothetical protein
LLVVEPEAGPSTEGFEDHSFQGTLTGVGRGFGSGFGRLGGRRTFADFNHGAWLRDALAPVWRRCGGAAGAARLTVEATLEEVADVLEVSIKGRSQGSEAERCLTQGAWDLDLPRKFDRPSARWTIQL